jgi:hypothetical protein
MEDIKLLGACGLYCGACYHYRASFPEGKHLLEDAARKGKNTEAFTCQGCHGGALYMYSHCTQCKIRICAEEKSLAHCGLCSQYPCEQLKAFQHDGRIHHLDIMDNLAELKTKEPEQWLEKQARQWTCECGTRFSWYETHCHTCGNSLKSYNTTEKEKNSK